MDAANPLCRCSLLAVGLVALIGCQSDRTSQLATARGQQPPLDPIAPIAPIAPPANVPPPGPTLAPVVGSPVGAFAIDTKGPVVPVGLNGAAKTAVTAADLLRSSVPRVKIVARVGESNVITDQEVIEGVYQQFRELAALDGHARSTKQKEMYNQVLRKTIERELILDEMYTKLKKANKMAIIDEVKELATQSIDRQLRMFRKDTGAKSDEEFAAILRTQGLTVQVIRRQMERQFMAEQYVSSVLKEKGRRAGLADVRAYYDQHQDEFRRPDRVVWQHLFIAVRNYPNAQAAYNQAAALAQQANAGADLAELSVKYDEGFAKQQKGLGAGEKRNEIQPADLEATVWSLRPGQVSDVLQTPTGYHLVKVVERDVAGVQPFDAALQNKIRDKLTRAQMENEYQKLVDELWRKGVVRVFDE
ncbi:peptidylprolyl isomerase [Gemmata sp. JC717]|uniref:peptidylprolyl isomerase n=1 Tax=Gemmata algarum TaxID=2975278 RepID=UPI0021BB5401|nr:peptidylprolyl isomerase [Gemmata algarum]MDY3553502.1 peptidylprolyl isomerase [Gemmata algarum]